MSQTRFTLLHRQIAGKRSLEQLGAVEQLYQTMSKRFSVDPAFQTFSSDKPPSENLAQILDTEVDLADGESGNEVLQETTNIGSHRGSALLPATIRIYKPLPITAQKNLKFAHQKLFK